MCGPDGALLGTRGSNRDQEPQFCEAAHSVSLRHVPTGLTGSRALPPAPRRSLAAARSCPTACCRSARPALLRGGEALFLGDDAALLLGRRTHLPDGPLPLGVGLARGLFGIGTALPSAAARSCSTASSSASARRCSSAAARSCSTAPLPLGVGLGSGLPPASSASARRCSSVTQRSCSALASAVACSSSASARRCSSAAARPCSTDPLPLGVGLGSGLLPQHRHGAAPR